METKLKALVDKVEAMPEGETKERLKDQIRKKIDAMTKPLVK